MIARRKKWKKGGDESDLLYVPVLPRHHLIIKIVEKKSASKKAYNTNRSENRFPGAEKKQGGVEMKKLAILLVGAFVLGALPIKTASASEVGMLIDKLVEKGVLSSYDAQILKAEAEQKTAEKELEENLVKTRWNRRLEFETPDGKFKGQIGGRIHADLAYLKGESALEDHLGKSLVNEGGALFRRARVYFQGSYHDNFAYKLQWDFASDAFADAYMRLSNIPYIGRVTVGQFKEPFSLEELTSSNNMTFVERALPNVFSPGRNWGVSVSNNWLDQRVTFSTGAFTDFDKSDDKPRNKWNLTSRITALPWYEASDKLAHIGVSHSLRKPRSYDMRLRQRPEMRIGERFVDTGDFRADMENRLGVEGALVLGAFSLQGEMIQSFIDMTDTSKDPYLFGAYGYASYFLTGENRRYSKGSGAFSGVSPKKNFSIKDRTWGAIELAARYSHLDLNDKKAGVEGGTMNNMTLGVNWYLNPNMRILTNYVHSHVNGVGSSDGVQARFQATF